MQKPNRIGLHALPNRLTGALIAVLAISAVFLPSVSHADTTNAAVCSEPIATGAGQSHKVRVDGHPIALWSKSPPSPKATLLLVHGRTWSGRPDFDLATACEDLSLMNGLNARGIATYAVDMRGYGDTPRDASGWLTPNRAAADIAAVLRWLGERNRQQGLQPPVPHLFGWSYGATMAQLSVQQHPELAQSLSLFGYAVRKGYAKTPKSLSDTPPKAANTYKNAVSDFIVPNSISSGAVEAFARAALAADPVRADWNQLEQWRALNARKVTIPTLLIQGEFDPLTRQRVHKKLFRKLAHSNKKWVVLKNGDHAAFMETPREEFLDHLASFIVGSQDGSQPPETSNTATNETE